MPLILEIVEKKQNCKLNTASSWGETDYFLVGKETVKINNYLLCKMTKCYEK